MGSVATALRRQLNHAWPGAIILLYHRVARLKLDPQLLAVTPDHFAQHMEVLRTRYRPTRLLDLRGSLGYGRPGVPRVAITFDDGYADNLHEARPVLARCGVPATVFVSSGMLSSDREFWWDALERVLLLAPQLPARLALRIDGAEHAWDLGSEAGCPPDLTGWNVFAAGPEGARQQAYRDLNRAFRALIPVERGRVLDGLFAWGGLEREARPTHRALGKEELVALEEDGVIEAGGHTVSHAALSALPAGQQETEIRDDKAALEKCLGHSVAAFSYPFGGRADFGAEAIAGVRGAGYLCACANFAGYIRWRADAYQLPRFVVRNWDGDEFARRLEVWLGR